MNQNVGLTFDGYGRLTNTTDSESSYSTTYDDREELVTGTRTYTDLPARTITYTYNPDGSRASLQLPVAPSGYSNGNCYTYAYDAGQRLTGITDNLGNTSTFSYGANNWLLGQNSANGLTAAFTRNALGQGTELLNQITLGGTTSSVSEFSDPGYDGVGNLTSITASIAASSSLSGTTTFGYDSKDELTSEVNGSTGAGYSNSFAYDSAGNATTFRGASRSFNSSNQFTGTGFAYDANGNPTTYNGATCTFDVFNRATSLGTAFTAGYRSDGLRAWKQDSAGVQTYYLYDGASPLVEMDASGNWKGEFLYGPAGLISHSRSGLGTVFFAYDALGSVQSVYGSTGSLISTRVYDAYGAQTGGIVASATYDDPEIGYNGQSGYITDPETGLVLCGHRYYDPAAGRWLNRDPIGYAGGIGLYNYCANNPVMGVDNSGLDAGWASGPGGPRSVWSGGGDDWQEMLEVDPEIFCYQQADSDRANMLAAGYANLAGMNQAMQLPDDAAQIANGNGDDTTLYRGVGSNSPAYAAAQEGNATPRGDIAIRWNMSWAIPTAHLRHGPRITMLPSTLLLMRQDQV